MISITPWRNDPENPPGFHVEDATGTHVCTIWEMNRPPQEVLSNLNVIVAAPQMLSDLRWLRETLPLSKAQIRRIDDTIKLAEGDL